MIRLTPILAFLLSLVPLTARADDFAERVDLATLETLTIQHNQTLKTLDSYARQTLSAISGRASLDDRPALYVVLDLVFRPEQYADRNLIRIKNVPLRKDFEQLVSIPAEEKQRILEEGTISLRFLMSPEVQDLLMNAQATAAWKSDAVNQVAFAAQQLLELTRGRTESLRIVPPATANPDDHFWHSVHALVGNMPTVPTAARALGQQIPPPLPNFDDRGPLLEKAFMALGDLREAWVARDVTAANAAIASLAEALPQVNPQVYPSFAKRKTEVIYNRLAKLTLPGAALYFVAFVCFLLAARSSVPRLRLWGLRFFAIGFLVHTLGIAIRWWLVEKNVGNWFEAIPIKNQFESVLFSAWFGAAVALVLELRKGRSIFGAAGSFVGWLSLTAIFATPYVFKKEIGGEIGQVNGVLMSYWLYIHVTLVTAAYALIGMSFCLGAWWLIRYYSAYGTLSRLPARQLSADAAGGTELLYEDGRQRTPRASDADLDGLYPAGGTAALSIPQTLAAMFFLPQRAAAAMRPAATAAVRPEARARSFLATLDLCNLVVLQLAFWVLGLGIILGAVWADQSWGRPWGWDPKETFALVTWIVYLIIVHLRFITPEKAWWTAVLSILGFFIMLFNWIGVNFFLVGLHSYA